jgi:hypothetical protein
VLLAAAGEFVYKLMANLGLKRNHTFQDLRVGAG